MLRDLAVMLLGIGLYMTWLEIKNYLIPITKKKVSPSVEFDKNTNPVEARMLFTKDQVLEVLAVHTAMRRQMKPGDYNYHGLISIDQNQRILNVRIEIKKVNHE